MDDVFIVVMTIVVAIIAGILGLVGWLAELPVVRDVSLFFAGSAAMGIFFIVLMFQNMSHM